MGFPAILDGRTGEPILDAMTGTGSHLHHLLGGGPAPAGWGP